MATFADLNEQQRLSAKQLKRKPYTHLACSHCKEKHLKCDGRKPACTTCMQKRLDCRYREERNRKRESASSRAQMKIEQDLRERMGQMQQEIFHWRNKYLQLKAVIRNAEIPWHFDSDDDETPSPLSLSPQILRKERKRSYSLPEVPIQHLISPASSLDTAPPARRITISGHQPVRYMDNNAENSFPPQLDDSSSQGTYDAHALPVQYEPENESEYEPLSPEEQNVTKPPTKFARANFLSPRGLERKRCWSYGDVPPPQEAFAPGGTYQMSDNNTHNFSLPVLHVQPLPQMQQLQIQSPRSPHSPHSQQISPHSPHGSVLPGQMISPRIMSHLTQQQQLQLQHQQMQQHQQQQMHMMNSVGHHMGDGKHMMPFIEDTEMFTIPEGDGHDNNSNNNKTGGDNQSFDINGNNGNNNSNNASNNSHPTSDSSEQETPSRSSNSTSGSSNGNINYPTPTVTQRVRGNYNNNTQISMTGSQMSHMSMEELMARQARQMGNHMSNSGHSMTNHGFPMNGSLGVSSQMSGSMNGMMGGYMGQMGSMAQMGVHMSGMMNGINGPLGGSNSQAISGNQQMSSGQMNSQIMGQMNGSLGRSLSPPVHYQDDDHHDSYNNSINSNGTGSSGNSGGGGGGNSVNYQADGY